MAIVSYISSIFLSVNLVLSAEVSRRGDSGAVPLMTQEKVTPNFAENSIPEAPQQKSPWTAPQTKLPQNLISAVSRLFEQGLADPRSLEYREIEVVVGVEWHTGRTVKTHGWILPAMTTPQRFAVCWNGLVYPVVSISNEADLQTDVEAAIRTDEDIRTKRASTSSQPFYRFRHSQPEGYSIFATGLLPLKVCLLLRLGKTELAERVWATWIAGMDAQINDDSFHLADPYLMLARDWIWAMYDRALNAHMRGDDRMCMISAVKATSMSRSIRQEISQRPILRARPYIDEYFDFLKPLTLLIQDQQRRAKLLRTSVPRSASILRQLTTGELIDYLDEAFAMQMSIPGGINMDQDPVVEELIRRGKDAVEPLLLALENDTRLTRSVRSSRPWNYDRHVMTVYETALQAVRQILSIGNKDFEDWEAIEKGIEGRRAVAARLRTVAAAGPTKTAKP
jgi:hypothetical protein